MTKKKKVSKSPNEKLIENAILTYLGYLPDCFAWKNNSTGIYDPTRGTFRSNKNRFAIKGVSDILGIYKGKFIAIEVKTARGKVTKEQQDFIDRVNRMGGIAGVARDINDVRKLLGVNNENETEELSE